MKLNSAWKRVRLRASEERGALTLAELLVAVPTMLAIFAATIGLYNVSVRGQVRGEDRVRSLIDQKNGMERMSRELRTAVAIKYKTSEIIDAQLARNKRWVHYDCSGGSCKRSEGSVEGAIESGPAVLIPGVRSADFQFFAETASGFQPNYVDPTYVVVTLKVIARGASNPVTLNDGFNLRNLTPVS